MTDEQVTDRSAAGPVPLTGNVADLVTSAAVRSPDRLALIDPQLGLTLSWAQTEQAVAAEADRIRTAGVAPGDRVVVRLPTSAPYCLSVFAALRVGAVVVPVGTGATERELDTVLAHSDARAVIVAGDDPVGVVAVGRAGALQLEPADPGASGSDAGPAPATGGEDLALIAYTSGTSGSPRGVMLSHRALLANLEQCAALRPAPVTAADRMLLAVPLFHSYGLGPGLFHVARVAATAVLLHRFEPELALEVAAQQQVTAVLGVPPMYRAWLDLGSARLTEGLSTVRMFLSGAAPLEPEVLAGIREATGQEVYEGYGLAEAGPVLTSSLGRGRAKPGSVGRALPGAPAAGVDAVELRLVDPEGRPLPDDEDAGGTGLVAARGPNLFSGYWPDGAGGPEDLDELGPGWLRTADVGFLDSEGDLHLVDRAGDLIIVSGFNVYPSEVEDVLREHPAVADAAVVAIPSAGTGEAVRAVVVPAGEPADEQELIDHCAHRLARFKVPVEVVTVDELPHSATGKLMRRLLRDLET